MTALSDFREHVKQFCHLILIQLLMIDLCSAQLANPSFALTKHVARNMLQNLVLKMYRTAYRSLLTKTCLIVFEINTCVYTYILKKQALKHVSCYLYVSSVRQVVIFAKIANNNKIRLKHANAIISYTYHFIETQYLITYLLFIFIFCSRSESTNPLQFVKSLQFTWQREHTLMMIAIIVLLILLTSMYFEVPQILWSVFME